MIQRVNPQDRSYAKWYAMPVNDGQISKTDITGELSAVSSLSRGDVSNVIENLIDILPKYLLMGKSVHLGEFGIFRLSFSSEGVETSDEFHAGKLTGIKVVFMPEKDFKRMLATIKLEKS
jgi:predicted histone-like DNA-binding protein